MRLFSLNKIFIASFFLLTMLGAYALPGGVALAQNSTQPLEHATINDVEFSCFWGVVPDLTCIMAWVSYSIMGLFAWLAGAMGVVMNYSVQELVVKMGVTVQTITAIDVAWSILRDIANVFLVFITLFMGIATILGISSYGYKQLFWRIIVAALFVNFSLFFTTIVIDVSNIAAINLYAGLAGSANIDAGCATTAGASADPCIKGGVSGAIMNGAKLTSAFDAVTLTAGGNGITHSDNDDVHWNIILASFMNGILFIILAFVYGAAAILLVTRFVVLIILMILSPIAFVAIITRVGGRKWWSMVLGQSLFAPAFFLMLLISIQIIATLASPAVNFLGVINSSVAAATGDVTAMSIFLNYAVVIGFIIVSLVVARSMGAYGSQAIIKTGQNWSRRAGMAAGATVGAATFGAGARLARGTVGRSAYERTQDSDLLERASQSGMRGRVARAQLGMYNKLSNTSFDARAVAGKNAQKWTGGPIDTFDGARKKRVKREEDLQKQIGNKNALSVAERNELGKAEVAARATMQEKERWERRVVDPQKKEVETYQEALKSDKLDEGTRKNYEARLKKAQEDLASAQAKAEAYQQSATAARENVETKTKATQDKAKAKAAQRVETRATNVTLDGNTPYGTQSDIERRELAQAGRLTVKNKDKQLLEDIRKLAKDADEKTAGESTKADTKSDASDDATENTA